MEAWKTAPRVVVEEEEKDSKKEKREKRAKEEEEEEERKAKERKKKEKEEEKEEDHGTAKMRLMNSTHCWTLHCTYLNPHLSERKGRPHCRGLPSVRQRGRVLRPPELPLHYPLAD